VSTIKINFGTKFYKIALCTPHPPPPSHPFALKRLSIPRARCLLICYSLLSSTRPDKTLRIEKQFLVIAQLFNALSFQLKCMTQVWIPLGSFEGSLDGLNAQSWFVQRHQSKVVFSAMNIWIHTCIWDRQIEQRRKQNHLPLLCWLCNCSSLTRATISEGNVKITEAHGLLHR
jgi:hypothetical protein